ncbi:MAG: ATP-binding protein [Deltaproteobacteria bacterium]
MSTPCPRSTTPFSWASPGWITTNLGYKQWGTVFGDAACLGALVDRLAQHCHVVDIDAESWREKQRREGRDTNGRGPKRRH